MISKFDTSDAIIEQLENLKKELEEKERLLRQKEIELDRTNQVLNTFSSQIKEFQFVFETTEAQKKIFIESHVKTLTQLEEKLRKEKRIWLNE